MRLQGKYSLVAAALLLLSATATRAQSPAATKTPAFEVVSIKPNKEGSRGIMIRMAPGGRFEAKNVTVRFLLQEAYGVKDSQISGAPAWFDSEHYDVEAKADDSFDEVAHRLGRDEQEVQLRQMLQAMLADRLKLVLHHDTKELSEYALVVAKNGPKFHETTAPAMDPAAENRPLGPPAPGAPMPRGSIRMTGRGELTLTGIGITQFADVLSRQLGLLVVDKTGLKGEYDFTLKWTPDEGQGQMFRGAGGPPPDGAPPPPDASGPSIFTALQEQLGLKLESQKGPVDTIVIDHVERPSEN
ncbi:MAG: TIGR03435 family protein [Bryobacteraceae bacterium]